MRVGLRLVIALLAFPPACLSAAGVRADGGNSPRLAEAIALWLADDDAGALPAMSELAGAGDAAAQMLLSQIERETPPGGETAYVLGLDRATRKALFRAPGGLSGTPWVRKQAVEGDALAAALVASKLPDATMETAHALHAAGEREQAKRLAWEIVDRGRFDAVLGMAEDAPLFADLDYVRWMRGWFAGGALSTEQRKWIVVSEPEGRAPGLMLASMIAPVLSPQLAPQGPVANVVRAFRGDATEIVEEGPGGVDYIAKMYRRLALREPDLRVAGRLCETICPERPGVCMAATVALLGGYDRLMSQDTPYEGAIPQADYLESPRAVNTLLRRLRAEAGNAASAASGSGYGVSSCLAEAVGE